MVRTITHPIIERWAQRQQEWADAAKELRPSLEAAVAAGDLVLAGESAGLVHDIVPAGELVSRIAHQARELLTRTKY
jgi:nitronate monooxygenase